MAVYESESSGIPLEGEQGMGQEKMSIAGGWYGYAIHDFLKRILEASSEEKMKCRRIVGAFFLAAFFSTAFAQSDRSAVESAANNFLQRLDSGDLASLYQADMSLRFKSATQESVFVQNIGIIRIQTGGPAATRKLIGAQALDQIPGVPDKGSFYYVRHHARFPAGAAFQDTYWEKVSGAWKVVGFWNFPAPPQ